MIRVGDKGAGARKIRRDWLELRFFLLHEMRMERRVVGVATGRRLMAQPPAHNRGAIQGPLFPNVRQDKDITAEP